MNAYQEEILKAVDNLAAEIARVQHVVEQAFHVSVEKPSVDEVVSYDGQPYKLVDRLARAGDVILMTGDTPSLAVEKGCLYEVVKDKNTNTSNLRVRTKIGYRDLYSAVHNRTLETIKVYEPTTWEDVQREHLLTDDVPQLPSPTPNERRAELIERAKQFVESAIERGRDRNAIKGDAGNETYKAHFYTIEFFTKENEVVASVTRTGEYGRYIKSQPDHVAQAKCMPGDVFNLDIAKAIAVGRALDIDVSEYANAVQPTEWVLGMGLRGTNFKGEHFYYDAITKITNDDEYGTRLWCKNSFATKNAKERVGQNCENPVITDDTNAQY